MTCDYQKNRLQRDIRKVKKIIERNESYVAYYQTVIRGGTETPTTRQHLADNEEFLRTMKTELHKLELELAAL